MNKLFSLFNTVMFCLLIPATAGLAQKGGSQEPTGIFQTGQEYDQFMSAAKQVAYGPDGNAELQAMIPMLNDIVLNRPIGSTSKQYGIQASTMGMLADEKVREDLAMSSEQFDSIKQANQEIQKRMAEQIRGLNFENADDVVGQIRDIRKSASDEINSALLPQQMERLQQIHLQNQIRRRSLVEILTSDPVKTSLEITDEKAEVLREEEVRIREDLAKEIAKLREEAKERLLSKLSFRQREQAEELIGDAFDFGSDQKEQGKKSRKSEK